MATGTVKFFNPRGFGFIVKDDGTGDVFVHVKSLPPGAWALRTGERVEFQERPSRRGVEAYDVKRLEQPSARRARLQTWRPGEPPKTNGGWGTGFGGH